MASDNVLSFDENIRIDVTTQQSINVFTSAYIILVGFYIGQKKLLP